MDLLDRVRRTIRHHNLARAETRITVALSGGSDSVALAHLLQVLDVTNELRIVGVAHFNHQLRQAAAADECFCEALAASLGWPLLVDREDVTSRARRERRSVEDAARTARHEFLERARLHFGADLVALGHTRDDQAETFLLRLLRGAGARGLAGMYPRRGTMVRPLLDCRRAELREYLESRRIAYITDESNADVTIPRNRVRLELLPLLERRFNPSIVDVLADEAELAREDWQWMYQTAVARASEISRREGVDRRIDVNELNRLPSALGRLVLYGAMTEASRGRAVGFKQVNRALRLCREGGPPLDAPGLRLERVRSDLVLTSRPEGAWGRWAPLEGAGRANLFHYPLSIPGEVQLREAGCVVSAETASSVKAAGGLLGNAAAVLRRDSFRAPLAVRNRRPGDRFRPLGLIGRKKLQDYFVDRKIARCQRDTVPIVVDDLDRIVWVAGHSIDDEFRVTDPAQAVLILRLKAGGSD